MTAEELKTMFIRRVLVLMGERGMSQADLAKAMKKSRPLVSRMLSGGRVPGGDTIADVATALNVDVCELLCEPKKRRK